MIIRHQIFLIWSVFLVVAANGIAQSSANYQYLSYSNVGDPLTDMSGSTQIIGGGIDDGPANSILYPIGFDFWFMGKRYTEFSANANGVIRLGGGIGTAKDNDLTQDSALIAPFWTDLATLAGTGSVIYKIIGIAPSRSLVVQWFQVEIESGSGTEDGYFELRLNETTGQIEFEYYVMARGSTTPVTASIGFCGGTSDNQFLAVTNDDLSMFTSNAASEPASQYLFNSVDPWTYLPQSEFIISLTPPVTAAPSDANISSITANSMSINFSSSAPSVNVLGYVLYRSEDGGVNYSFVDTNYGNQINSFGVQSGLIPGKEYYWKIHSFSEGGLSTPLIASASTLFSSNVIQTAGSGSWDSTVPDSPWPDGQVPTDVDQVIISTGHSVTINSNAECYRLTVQSGAIIEFEETTARTFSVTDSVRIDAGGIFRSAISGSQLGHNLTVQGHIYNEGTLDFSSNSNLAGAQILFEGPSQSSLSGNGLTTDIRKLVINKPSSGAEIKPGNLTVLGFSSNAPGFISLVSGLLHLSGSFTLNSSFWVDGGYFIPSESEVWLANPNASISAISDSLICNGTLRVSGGTLTVGTSPDHSIIMQQNSQFILQNGTVNITGGFISTGAISYLQQGGALNVATIGNTSPGSASFLITSSMSMFNISGGIITIHQAHTNVLSIDYQVENLQPTLTGGMLQIGSNATAGKYSFKIAGFVPELVMDNTSHYKNAMIRGTVYFDINIEEGDTLFIDTLHVRANIINDGAINAANADLTLDGNQFQSVTGVFLDTINTLTLNNSSGLSPAVIFDSNLHTSSIKLLSGAIENGNHLFLGKYSSASLQQIFRSNGHLLSAPVFLINSYHVTYLQAQSTILTSYELPPEIKSLSINNILGVTLSKSVMTDSLYLYLGVLNTTAANSITVTGTNSNKIAGANVFSYVSGPLIRYLPANLVSGQAYAWPIGKNGFHPVELINPVTDESGKVIIETETFEGSTGGIPGDGIGSLYTDRYWKAQRGGAGNLISATLAIHTGNYSLPQTSIIAQSATANGIYAAREGLVNLGIISSSEIDMTLGFFAIATPDIPLPVELSLFNLSYHSISGITTIQWQTESETDNAFFIVEKKKNGENTFEKIKTVKGQGTLSTATSYVVQDASNQPGDTIEYRLGDISFDGTIFYHNSKKIYVPKIKDILLYPNYPNPFNPYTTITYELPERSKVSLKIYNIMGQEIRNLFGDEVQEAGRWSVSWDGHDRNNRLCASGVYFCRLIAGDQIKIIKMNFLK